MLLKFEYKCSNIKTLALIYGYYLQFLHLFGGAPMPHYVASVFNTGASVDIEPFS